MPTIGEFRKQRRNANRHTERGLKLLSESVERDGWIGALTVAADGETFDGSARLVTAQQDSQLEPIIVDSDGSRPVIVRRTDIATADDPKAKRLGVMANHVTATDWEPDAAVLAEIAKDDAVIAALAKEDARLAELLRGEAKQEPKDAGELVDKAAELQAKWQVQRGDVWQVGRHRVMCGDSTNAADVATLMQGERAQIVVTSPPYPGADMWDDSGTVRQIEQIGLDALRVVVDFIDDGCAILWNIANTPIGTQAGVVHTTTTTTTKHASESLGLLCYGEIIWAKPVQHLTPLAFMMRPVVPNLIHEYVMIFYKGKRNQRESKSGLTAEQKSYRTSSVWEISPESAKEIGHKAPFPVELATRCISLWSLEGDKVLEPFCGSGTTLVSCERIDRTGYGMEIEPSFVSVALERLAGLGLTPQRIGNARNAGIVA